MIEEYANEMMVLFKGLSSAYGIYHVGEVRLEEGQKQSGKAITHRGEVTLDLWMKHLSGQEGLGIVPIMEDSTCLWGAIDIDDYMLDHTKLVQLIRKNELPFVVCRTKSGGAHLYVFFNETIQASIVQNKLREMAAGLGFGNSEIFPKQISISVERGDIGNWLNMPYFDYERTARYAIDVNGKSVTLADFLAAINKKKINEEELKDLKIEVATDDIFEDGPPCLPIIYDNGVSQGERNTVLFNTGILLRRHSPDGWEDLLEQYNKRLASPLGSSEIAELVRSLSKDKDYYYQCKNDPLQLYCNSMKCRTRKFGVQPLESFPKFSGIRKFGGKENPSWFVDIEGIGSLILTTEELFSFNRVRQRSAEQLNYFIPGDAKRWGSVLSELMGSVTEVLASEEEREETTPRGKFKYLFAKFVNTRRTTEKEMLKSGHVWFNGEDIVFSLQDLEQYLTEYRFNYSGTRISHTLRDMGARAGYQLMIANKNRRYWIISKDVADEDQSTELPPSENSDVF